MHTEVRYSVVDSSQLAPQSVDRKSEQLPHESAHHSYEYDEGESS